MISSLRVQCNAMVLVGWPGPRPSVTHHWSQTSTTYTAVVINHYQYGRPTVRYVLNSPLKMLHSSQGTWIGHFNFQPFGYVRLAEEFMHYLTYTLIPGFPLRLSTSWPHVDCPQCQTFVITAAHSLQPFWYGKPPIAYYYNLHCNHIMHTKLMRININIGECGVHAKRSAHDHMIVQGD